MPSPTDTRRRDLRQRDRRRRRSKVRPRRVVVGTVLVTGLLGAAAALNPFASAEQPSVRFEATNVGALVERASDAVSRGFVRDDTADRGEPTSSASPTVTATTTAEASPAPAPSSADPADGGTAGTGAAAPSTPAPAPAPAAPAPAPEVPATVALAQEIVVLTNAERRKAGLGELTVNDCATSMAVVRTDRLVAEGRFEHDPLGEIVDACGVGTLGENLALGYPTAAAVVAGWMGSEGHRANILRPGYTQIGVGCTSGPKGMLCGQVFLG
ncbi:hypothetical protein Cch01nite_42800 [Cellulomonas chitinilytica]|uniref:SCP domain-containing protein n=1 Tax=Cellulomonas chitinilytica TaxID=398759 RepID=A0A919U3R4_9CELL|nr:CAP domain-containing protein [Cellulomonas chitinilytica]GIG23556.1 hypothetical protein Cch01nite_42800 [Cellulomonas chitinilytica]